MVTARIAGLSPGTSPPPVRIPIRPFLVLMRPLCRFLRACKRKIDGSDWVCKRHRSEPPGKFRPVRFLPNQIPAPEPGDLTFRDNRLYHADKPNIANAIESSARAGSL